MGLTDTVFGTPGETTIHQTPAMKPPGYGVARDIFNSLLNISRNPYPTFTGQLDPGLSPTMQQLMRQAQGYSSSGPPEILAGVQGSLGRFMNPSFINPAFRVPMGAPDYANQNPNQRIYGGQTVSGAAGAFGARGPSSAPPSYSGSPGAPPAPSAFKGGSNPNAGGTFQGIQGDPNSYTAQPGGQVFGSAIGRMDGGGYGPDYTKPVNQSSAAQSIGELPLSHQIPPDIPPWLWDPGPMMPNTPGPGGPLGGGPPQRPGLQPPPSFGGGRGTYGGYSSQQLLSDPSLISRLGQHALGRWNQAQGAPQGLGGGGNSFTAARKPLQTAPMFPGYGQSGQDIMSIFQSMTPEQLAQFFGPM